MEMDIEFEDLLKNECEASSCVRLARFRVGQPRTWNRVDVCPDHIVWGAKESEERDGRLA